MSFVEDSGNPADESRSGPGEVARLIEQASVFLAGNAVGGEHSRQGGWPRRILLPYAGSQAADHGLEAVIGLSSLLGAEVWVLHVREWEFGRGNRWFAESREDAAALVRKALHRLDHCGIPARGIVRQAERSYVAREINRKAVEIRACGIILGARPRRLVPSVVFGSTSRQVMRSAKCPVVFVPAASHKRAPKRFTISGEDVVARPKRRPAA